jgi:hypothetical protein
MQSMDSINKTTIRYDFKSSLIITKLIIILSLIIISVDSKEEVFTNQFVIEAEGGINSVKQLALKHGFIFLGHVSHHQLI